jgi:AcrR family transcriptional regulator
MPKETFFNLKPEKRERILRCAIGEFRQFGFGGANIGTIAGKAGVAKGSMYQYFQDKSELFVHCVTWSLNILLEKVYGNMPLSDIDMFEFYSRDMSATLELIREEKDLALFSQDVYLGKYSGMPGGATAEMMRIADDYALGLIREGQKKGTIRNDIDAGLLNLFFLGAAVKIKEHILKEMEELGFDITDGRMENYKVTIANMIDMLKNGIGAKEGGRGNT